LIARQQFESFLVASIKIEMEIEVGNIFITDDKNHEQ
jgi:hypothetical protein